MEEKTEAARVERGPITEVPHFALGMAALLERQGFTVAAAEMRRLVAQRDQLLGALRLTHIECQHLHHAKKDQHSLGQPCPVVARINAAIAQAKD